MRRSIFLAMTAATAASMLFTVPAMAKEFKTEDGNISIELPEEGWSEVVDPEAEFVFTNGVDVISAKKFDPDEKVEVARNDDYYNAVLQLSYAYTDQLIVLTAQVAEATDLPEVYEALTSIKFSGISTDNTEKKKMDNYSVADADLTLYVGAEEGLNLRENFSITSEILTMIPQGEEVHVTGVVKFNDEEIGWDRVEYDGMTGYVAAINLVKTKDEIKSNPTFEEIVDDIDYYALMYYADGSQIKIIVLNDGRMLDMNGNKVVGFADGAYQMYDGTVIYQFNPTTTSLDDLYRENYDEDIVTPIGEDDFAVHNDYGATYYIHDGGDGYFYNADGRQFWLNEAYLYIDTETKESWYE